MATWKWFNGMDTWGNWIPGYNIYNWIKGLTEDEWRTPIGTLEYGGNSASAEDVISNIANGGSSGNYNIWDILSGKASQADQYQYNLALQQQAQDFNSAEAQKDRDFQLMMSNTAYQRGVQDLQAAGLNPWLAVQGSGASTASGSTASSSSAGSVGKRDSGMDMIKDAVGSALSLALILKVFKKLL